jgi:hypothetical protein
LNLPQPLLESIRESPEFREVWGIDFPLERLSARRQVFPGDSSILIQWQSKRE